MTKTEIFTKAWQISNAAAARFGGKARQFFAATLREVYAYARKAAVKVAAPIKTTVAKVRTLASIMAFWPTAARKSFAFRFVSDNASRTLTYGEKTMFSAKQTAIIDEMYAKYC